MTTSRSVLPEPVQMYIFTPYFSTQKNKSSNSMLSHVLSNFMLIQVVKCFLKCFISTFQIIIANHQEVSTADILQKHAINNFFKMKFEINFRGK